MRQFLEKQQPQSKLAPILELRAISKSFPGTRALDNVHLSVRRGEVIALVGENGAGKSTLMKILSGVWPRGTYDGEIRVFGKLCEFNDTQNAHLVGIAMIHQELSIFPELTVAENLELDRLPRWIRWHSLYQRTQFFLDELNLGLHAETKVRNLSMGERQLVEIAAALYRDAQILVFDEPTSALTEQEVKKLYDIIEKLRQEGRAIIYITHRMSEIFHLADRIVVLRDGKNAGEISRTHSDIKIPKDEMEPKLITWMVGRPLSDIFPKKSSSLGPELLRVEGLHLRSPQGKSLLNHIRFTLHAGEVLGLAGLMGAGRSETMEALFGVLNSAGPRGAGYSVSGHVWVKKVRRELHTPSDAIRTRMAFVSEDRKGNGLVLNQSIRNNMVLPALIAGRNQLSFGNWLFSPIKFVNENTQIHSFAHLMKLRAAHVDQPVNELSGGNQQKVVLAKWLMIKPEILFLDEPTRGIDVGAKVEIYNWIQKLAAEGMGIVLASSEMPELLGLCHRILVLREGRFSAELTPQTASQEDIMRAASL